MDYKELVTILRQCADENKTCCECPRFEYDDGFCVYGGIEKLMSKAADAIEKLSKQHEAQRQNLIALINERPHWIPVTEWLPEESEKLHWHDDMTIRFVSVWCCDYTTGNIGVRNRFEGEKTGNDYLDQYTKDTVWHWSDASWEPTHWMSIVPLPEPPKEETWE